MAQLSAIITTGDSDFRSTITTLLRSSGLSIGIIEEKHAGGTWPDLAVVDMRNGTPASVGASARAAGRGRGDAPPAGVVAVDVDLRRRRLVGARSDPAGHARGRQRVSRLADR